MKNAKGKYPVIIAALLFIFGISGLLWSFLPPTAIETENTLQVVRVPLSSAEDSLTGVLMTPYNITIKAPMRLKSNGKALLEFALSPTDFPLALTTNDRDIYQTHNVMLELRPEFNTINLTPSGTLATALLDGQEIKARWEIQSNQPGNSEGSLWCYLVFYPRDTNQSIERTAFLIKPLTFKTSSFFGLSTRWAAVVSAAAITAGLLIGLPMFNQDRHSTFKRK